MIRTKIGALSAPYNKMVLPRGFEPRTKIGALSAPYNKMVLPRGFEPLPHP